MGISLELYRALIGLGGFAPLRNRERLNSIKVKRPFTVGSIAIVLIILALAGDVELNPGPGHGKPKAQQYSRTFTSTGYRQQRLPFTFSPRPGMEDTLPRFSSASYT